MAKTADVDYLAGTSGRDLTVYATKEPTAKIKDFVEWAENVLDTDVDLRSAYIAITLYGAEFQGSEFNKSQTLARREARAAAAESNGAGDEPEADEAPAPKRRGRPAKPAAEKTATGRGRGRGRAAKPAGAAAPF